MKSLKNLVLVGVWLTAAAGVLVLKRERLPVEVEPATLAAPPAADTAAVPAALPRLLELGADKCMACKMMAPIIAELRTEYAGRLQVDFIDVWKNESAGEDFDVRVIPLQIFFDASGAELFRHEGFFAKEDILAKWRELGVDLPEEVRP